MVLIISELNQNGLNPHVYKQRTVSPSSIRPSIFTFNAFSVWLNTWFALVCPSQPERIAVVTHISSSLAGYLSYRSFLRQLPQWMIKRTKYQPPIPPRAETELMGGGWQGTMRCYIEPALRCMTKNKIVVLKPNAERNWSINLLYISKGSVCLSVRLSIYTWLVAGPSRPSDDSNKRMN